MKLLIIHLGYPKAASTFLQKKVFSKLKGYEYLSDSKKYKDLYRLKRKVFYTKPSDTLVKNNYIQDFSSKLNKIINNSKEEKFIFSSEAILNFYRFNGELNLISLVEIIKNLQENTNIKIKLLSIVRRQDEMLHSIFTYSYDVFRGSYNDINSFINDFGSPNFNSLFKNLDYSKIDKYFMKNNSIKIDFLLLEHLKFNPKEFMRDINRLIENTSNIDDISIEIINSNSMMHKKVMNSKNFYLMSDLHHRLKKFQIYRILIPARLTNLIKTNNFLNPKVFSEIDEESVGLILREYKEGNMSLAKNNNFEDQIIKYKYI